MSDIRPALQEIILVYREQLIGFSEARSLLEYQFEGFDQIRDHDLDKAMSGIEEAERELAEARGDGKKVGDPEDEEDE